MEMKTCTRCGVAFPATEEYFNKHKAGKHGLESRCKKCRREQREQYLQRPEVKKREQERSQRRWENIENKKKQKEYDRQRWQDPEHKEAQRQARQKLLQDDEVKENRQKYRREYVRAKRLNDPSFKIRLYMSSRINMSLKCKVKKSAATMELVGCSKEEFKKHIEKQFDTGMSWNNHGMWHIDHIVPCASFDLTDPEQQRLCFHYTNLQPLWAKDNLSKGGKLPHEWHESSG